LSLISLDELVENGAVSWFLCPFSWIYALDLGNRRYFYYEHPGMIYRKWNAKRQRTAD
jgi:hypothetical protein